MILKKERKYFEDIILTEFIDNNFLFKMKKNQDTKSIGFFFGLFESNKSDCFVTEYSIRQTSLEQIFNLTGLENIEMAMTETDNKIPENRKEVAYALLERFGIVKSKADRRINNLSGGEQQRIAIARAIASNVDLIFADEPTGNLDTATEKEIIKIFKDLTENYGKTVIVVTHSNMVSELSDHRTYLHDGILTDTPPVE